MKTYQSKRQSESHPHTSQIIQNYADGSLFMVILWLLKGVTCHSNTANKATKLSTVSKMQTDQESADFSSTDFKRSKQPFCVKNF